MDAWIERVERELLPGIDFVSEDPHEPVVVRRLPGEWKLVGTGNYAAVTAHPDLPDLVVKVYAPGRAGWKQEVEVYRRLGEHPAYSRCYYASEPYLILKRLNGVTLYECFRKGVRIPQQVIHDIEDARDYARRLGLKPQDLHGKNVMLESGRGKIVDVSDFLDENPDQMWEDMKKAYYKLYLPFIYRNPFPLPNSILNGIRKSYRWLRRRPS
ncbi:serine/threonine protein kinase [Paenibacillus lutrae]|uniref:Serine/threonine protein kinase n=1 Tax=Paenibacillus lutrae TaxID=2078573 RepID=A0A7X3FFJ8_9BACL|nr:serine/threonine protein kinase [Paenibacillus lutrae]MVO98667.1 serine/threonine protein kinase [Paenibacillus lutrae]